MKKYFIVTVALISLALPSALSAAWGKPDPLSLNIANEEQETNYWCWAALIKQVINWRGMGQAPSQCDIVNIANAYKGWNNIDCCAEPGRPECSRLGDNKELETLISLYGGRVNSAPVPTTPDEVYKYLFAKQVLLAVVEYSDSNNKHIYMIRGISWEGEEAVLIINDPAISQSRTIKFSEAQDTWQQIYVVE